MDQMIAGMSVDRLERIAPAVMHLVGPDRMAGVVTLASRRGEIVHSAAQGLSSRETETPMEPDTIFRIYSMTKPITCVALMSLWERGLVRLDDPVSRYIPAMADLRVLAGGDASHPELVDLDRAVTVRDLMTHTAGMTYHVSDYGPVEKLYRESGIWKGDPLPEFIRILCELPLAFQPGTEFRYSVAHDAVGYLVQIVSGLPLADFLQELIFGPLGMTDTGFGVSAEKVRRFSAMYGSMDVLTTGGRSSAALSRASAGANELLESPSESAHAGPNPVSRGGTGMVSTAPDYMRFCRMLLGGGALDGARVLGRKTLELMTTNHLAPDLLPYRMGPTLRHGRGYGLGFGVLMDVGRAALPGSVGQYGWGGAASTNFWVDPAEELIGIEMAQFKPSQYHPIAEVFRTAVYQAIVE